MRLFLPSSLLVTLLALSGCTAADDAHDGKCPERNSLGRVTAINGTSVAVKLLVPVSEYVVLETKGADFHYYAGSSDSCFEAFRDDLAEGQEIEFHVGTWGDASPRQAQVRHLVIRG